MGVIETESKTYGHTSLILISFVTCLKLSHKGDLIFDGIFYKVDIDFIRSWHLPLQVWSLQEDPLVVVLEVAHCIKLPQQQLA